MGCATALFSLLLVAVLVCEPGSAWIRFPGGPRSVATLGDLDGDGRAEAVIACSFSGDFRGVAALVDGRSGEMRQVWRGANEFGGSVAACGDVDGDGWTDAAISSPGAACVDVFSSRSGARVRRIVAPHGDARFGEEIAAAGDVDLDGRVDLVVGAPGAARAYVLSAKDGRVLLPLDNGEGGGEFGRAVAGGGDLDGDGCADVLVGAPDEARSGAVRAFSGRDGRRLWNDWSLGLAPHPRARVGISIAVLRDVNGDGACDALVGADGIDACGRAFVVDGRSGAKLWSTQGLDVGFARFGSSVAALGDLDGDGVLDLAIGDPNDSAAMSKDADDFMPRGQAPGAVYAISGRRGTRLWIAAGDDEFDQLGRCVSSAGDVDGDGVDDVLAMAMNGLSWTHAEPYYRMFSGRTGELLRTSTLPEDPATSGELALLPSTFVLRDGRLAFDAPARWEWRAPSSEELARVPDERRVHASLRRTSGTFDEPIVAEFHLRIDSARTWLAALCAVDERLNPNAPRLTRVTWDRGRDPHERGEWTRACASEAFVHHAIRNAPYARLGLRCVGSRTRLLAELDRASLREFIEGLERALDGAEDRRR